MISTKIYNSRTLEKDNVNYQEKVNELKCLGGIEADTENLVPLVTNSERFPDVPAFLPKFILINNHKILVLKKNKNIVKFKNKSSPLTSLILCEPFTSSDQLNQFEMNSTMINNAVLRMKEILPFSEYYPEMVNDT
jgi:hypothetical protein